jgi:Flp pilus assembly CpaF family ATPase
MAIVGGMRTGKTTLLNALLYEMVEMALRVLTIEDTRELQCSVPNHIALYSKKGLRTMQDQASITASATFGNSESRSDFSKPL